MGLLEPFAIPGLGKGLLELLIIFSVIVASGVVVTISSIVGIIRAVRRRRRGRHSVSAAAGQRCHCDYNLLVALLGGR